MRNEKKYAQETAIPSRGSARKKAIGSRSPLRGSIHYAPARVRVGCLEVLKQLRRTEVQKPVFRILRQQSFDVLAEFGIARVQHCGTVFANRPVKSLDLSPAIPGHNLLM